MSLAVRDPNVLYLNRVTEDVLSFGRANFLIDILFKDPQGFRLTPKVFTKTTMRMAPEDRIPSTSSKDHLPFFADRMDKAGDFVRDLIDYTKLQKMRSTYIGINKHTEYHPVSPLKNGKKYPKKAQDALEEAGVEFEVKPSNGEDRPASVKKKIKVGDNKLILDQDGRPWWEESVTSTGFWKYLSPSNRVHSSFLLHGTVTGRTSSKNPNFQNVPKRGTTVRMAELVSAYRKTIVARPGHVLIEGDLSQAELRIAAWMAGEPTMLRIYREGGDIHATTAAKVMGLTIEEFNELPAKEKKAARQKGKGVGFGYLFGMWWKAFRAYAKTNYGVDVTDAEAEQSREDFFELYSGLESWHEGMRRFSSEHGYVRALHGSLRRLPSVRSSDEWVAKEAQRQAINSPVQRMASDIGLMGMTRFAQACPWDRMHPIGFIHDAVVLEAREEHAEEAMGALKWFLQNPPLDWFDIESPIPILSDVSVGTSLGSMEERPDIEAIRPAWTEDKNLRIYV